MPGGFGHRSNALNRGFQRFFGTPFSLRVDPHGRDAEAFGSGQPFDVALHGFFPLGLLPGPQLTRTIDEQHGEGYVFLPG